MGVSDWTVRRWITAGAQPARKLPSGGLRVAVADLEEVGEPVRPDRSGTHRRPQRQFSLSHGGRQVLVVGSGP